MADFDAQDFYEQTGIDVRLAERQPEPALSPFAARLRDELLDHVTRARAALEIIEGLLRQDPNNDGAFDAVDGTFSASLDAARAAFERFRGPRSHVRQIKTTSIRISKALHRLPMTPMLIVQKHIICASISIAVLESIIEPGVSFGFFSTQSIFHHIS